MRKVQKLFVLIAGCLLLLLPKLQGQGTDYKFHTVFIYNFTKYIKWPDDAPSDKFVIGVLGKSEITEALKEMAATKKVNGKAIEVKVFTNVDDIKDCHMIFLPTEKSKELTAVRTKLASKPVLIISEKSGLAQQGSGINFIMSDGRWKFEVNQAATDNHRLKVSQELIKFAVKVYTEV